MRYSSRSGSEAMQRQYWQEAEHGENVVSDPVITRHDPITQQFTCQVFGL